MNRRQLLISGFGTAAAPLSHAVRVLEVVDVDLTDMRPGDIKTVTWKGQLVFIRYRTNAEVADAQATDLNELRDPEADDARVLRDEWLIVLGSCTHGGCVPSPATGQLGGWYCLCHGSVFDISGRVREGPALQNLTVPPYTFLSPNRIRIGAATQL